MTGASPEPDPTTTGRKDGDFPASVIKTLEQQAASRCCNPGCGQPTRAQSWDGAKAISIGTAAHIHAAAPGGARYDAGMTPDERKSAGNGIWMCRNCGTLIDADQGGFPADLLRAWKKAALASRRAAVIAPARRLHPQPSPNGTAPPNAADVQRYCDLIAELPSDGPGMTWLREWDAGGSFIRAQLSPLAEFWRRWTAPERAFNTPRVQAAMVTLTNALGMFLDQVSFKTASLKGDLQGVPPEWADSLPEKFEEAVAAINAHAEATVAAHAEFIRVAKEELRT